MPDQRAGQPHSHRQRQHRLRHGRPQLGFQRPGPLRQEQADGVDERRLLALQGGQHLGGRQLLGPGLGEVERGREPVGEPCLHQPDVLAGDRHALSDDLLVRLDAAQLHVVLREFRDACKGHTVPRFDRRQRAGILRLDGAADLAEQVELPGGGQAALEEVEFR